MDLAAALKAVRNVLTRRGCPLRMRAKTRSSCSLPLTWRASSAVRNRGIGTSRRAAASYITGETSAHARRSHAARSRDPGSPSGCSARHWASYQSTLARICAVRALKAPT